MCKLKHSVVDEIPEYVYDTLNELGVPSHLKGYDYLAYAVNEGSKNLAWIDGMTKVVYPEIASKFEVVFDSSGNLELINKYFGYSCNCNKGKATNTHFISTISRVVRRKALEN